MARAKVQIRFRKGGDLRLVSHHDLMRCFERMLRRAELPFHSTEGFNPKPRMSFPLSLALGIEGCEEVFELELDAELPPEEVRERLTRQAPPGLDILTVRQATGRRTARVCRVCYRLPLPPGRAAEAGTRAAALLAGPHCWVERTRPQPRRLDLRPYIRNLHVLPDGLEMDLWVTPTGTARPEELVALLGLGDLLDAGAVVQRTTVELLDEPEATPTPGGVPRPPFVKEEHEERDAD
jgi:radical SAM-linked protein